MHDLSQIADHVAFYRKKHAEQSVPWLLNRKLLLHKQLERPPRTLVVYSDLHGSYEKFLFWLKQGLGTIRLLVREMLGRWYSDDVNSIYAKLILLQSRARLGLVERAVEAGNPDAWEPGHLFERPVPPHFREALVQLEKKGLRRTRVLDDLLMMLREVTRHDEHRVFKAAPREFHENLMTLYVDAPQQEPIRRALLRAIAASDDIFVLVADLLARLIDLCFVDKHVNLGDTFDRGNDADRLVMLYRTYFDRGAFSPFLHYIWGNHDLLWLGASVGNPALVATALRISLRYSNFAFCRRYGFDLTALRELALRSYPSRPRGSYAKRVHDEQWGEDDLLKMTKTLLVLEAKLAASETRAAAAEEGRFRAELGALADHYEQLLGLIPAGVAPDAEAAFLADHPLYTDAFFPTVDASDRARLTPDEQAVMDGLVHQFRTLKGFQADLQWLAWKGEMYRVVDGTLYFHAAFPAAADGTLAEVGGLHGKALFDYLQREIKRVAEKHANGFELTPPERHLFFFLWCAPRSPLFCKSKMATLERAILAKEPAAAARLTTWKEDKDPFYRNIRDPAFIQRLLSEFHAATLCIGHTPIKDLGEGILSEELAAFIVDGGAAEAYGDRGTLLIKTPEHAYLTLNPSLDQLRSADDADVLYEPVVQKLDARAGIRLSETETGYFLQAELTAIDGLLADLLPGFMHRVET